jgi:hypothetical protein
MVVFGGTVMVNRYKDTERDDGREGIGWTWAVIALVLVLGVAWGLMDRNADSRARYGSDNLSPQTESRDVNGNANNSGINHNTGTNPGGQQSTNQGMNR